MKKIYNQLNILSFVIIIIATALYLPTPSSWLRSGKIYVSPQGHDWLWGSTPSLAVRTIQRAVNMASAGEEIVIMPGIYRETIHIRNSGSKDNPITLKAHQSGTVTITNAVTSEVVQSLTWTSEGDDIFSTQPPWNVYRVAYEGQNLYHAHWGFNLDKFRALVKRKNAYGAFYFDANTQKLYVFLPKGKALSNITIPKKVPSPDQFGNVTPVANVWVEANHLIFEGLQFDFGIGSGILLWNASHILIKDCLFSGSAHGISDNYGIHSIKDITVEYSLYHNYPQYDWLENWLTWREVYSTAGNSALVNLKASEVVIRNNIVAHTGDGMQVSPQEQNNQRFGAKIYHNLFFKGTDDAIEFDGQAQDVHVYENLVYDYFVSLGLSPVLKGPVNIENNLFLHPYKDGQENYPTHLKLLNPWFKPDNPKNDSNTIRNITLFNNVFVGNWLAWWHEAPVKDTVIKDNLFAVQRVMQPPLPDGVVEKNNKMINLPLSGYPNPVTDEGWLKHNDWQPLEVGPRWLKLKEFPATQDVDLLSPNLIK